MRPLAFVIHDLNSWGGHDRSTLEIARRLSHRWPVEIYSYTLDDPRGLESWGSGTRFHRITPNLSHPVLVKITWFYGATLPSLRLLPRIKGRPAPLVHATGACSLVSDVVQVQFVNAAWKDKQRVLPPDVCAPPGVRGGGRTAVWAREAYHELLLRYNVAIEKRVYTPGKTYIAIARSVADELRDHFGLNERIKVIHHGVDSELFRPAGGGGSARSERESLRSELGIGPGELAIAFVGAYERKGLAVAIDAVALLPPESRARVRLMAIGGGASEGFATRAREQGVGDRVLFVGHKREVAPYYQAADLFVLPTLYEPFGLVILEAMASALPPVVSRLAGASELIEDGVSGILIDDPTDPAEVARHLDALVRDETRRLAMAQAARKVAENRSWDRVAEEYAQVLGPLLSGTPA